MADRNQINPVITAKAKELLLKTCKERGCSQSHLVDAALLAFLDPDNDGAQLGMLLRTQQAMQETQQEIHQMLKDLLAAFAAIPIPQEQTPEPEKENDKPPIATYEQMYGPIPEPVPEVDDVLPSALPRPRRRLWHWFLKEHA
jgi:hypothetical protein